MIDFGFFLSVSVVSASVSAANLNGQACNKSSVSLNIQILVKIVRRLLVLVGPGESAVLGEIVRRYNQLQISMPGNLQLVSCHDADVFRSNTTSSEASPHTSSLAFTCSIDSES
jgi:hypothetical protein